MPDALGAWPSLTARETLVMTGRLYGFDRARAERAPRACSTRWGSRAADTPARVLSRGQKQRLGLARALVHDPRVLLLDEPASGLDPQARIDLRVLLRRLAAEGRTILISSHILSELEEVVDEAVFLVDGATVSSERVAAAATRLRTWRIRLADRDATAARLPVAQTLGWTPRSSRSIAATCSCRSTSDATRHPPSPPSSAAGLPVAEFAAATGLLEHTFLDLEGGRS
jgi:ABC-type multidrug transport system ATPase subunit